MREILFRGKRLDNGEWVIGANYLNAEHIKTKSDVVFIASTGSKCTGDLDDCGNIINIFNCSYFAVDPLTVGQFTGLTDKNGKMAFEGDRIRYKDKYHNTYGVIKFGEIPHDFGNNGKHIGFYLEWENDGANEWDAWLRHDIAFWISERECEIIGTIYDKENT